MASPVRALIVENAAVDNLILSTMLHTLECQTTVAKNGKEVVELFLAGKKFDIVFCAKYMPVMNGLEAVQKIRAMGETDVTIVGVSADNHAMEAFMSAGADVFVAKPMSLDALELMIQEVTNKNNNTMHGLA